jgi:hypothetical protein
MFAKVTSAVLLFMAVCCALATAQAGASPISRADRAELLAKATREAISEGEPNPSEIEAVKVDRHGWLRLSCGEHCSNTVPPRRALYVIAMRGAFACNVCSPARRSAHGFKVLVLAFSAPSLEKPIGRMLTDAYPRLIGDGAPVRLDDTALITERSRPQILASLQAQIQLVPAPERQCVRIPSGGPEAIILVAGRAGVGDAYRLLGAAHVEGSVEVWPGLQYEQTLTRLAQVIEAEEPPSLTRINVGVRSVPGLQCSRADIQLGIPGEVSEQALAWARSVIERWGEDRVTSEYTPVAQPALLARTSSRERASSAPRRR